ncbi:phage holin [Desemzia sp. C1]|uniref:phage holin n=1 Tax=Desemzia sp. C1 TaxID=2892016 RepID=UPI001E2B91B3|nr:phage holin [Desemzia sp. C1]MCI3027668.1 phage holin [Desemzia sp. C1]
MKINWKIRFKNPQFIAQLFMAIFIPILTYAGITAQDITSWAILWELLIDAVSNPYVLGTILVSLYNAVIDPTTKGLSDSIQALNYTEPRKDDI